MTAAAKQGREPLLGVLGGMGPEATRLFYGRLIRRTKAARDQEHLPVLIYGDCAVPDRTAAILSGDTAGVEARLIADAKMLERAGCTLLAMTCNTAYHFAPAIRAAVSIPLLDMPGLAARRARDLGVRRVALLGTEGCMRAGIYQRACAGEGLDCWTPDGEVQGLLTTLIYDQIKAGKPGDETLFARVEAAARAAGCDGAVLACTEMSVFHAGHPGRGLYVDAMEALAEACIAACGKELREDAP